MNKDEWLIIKERLATSPFRSRFHLTKAMKEYCREKGENELRVQVDDIVRRRLKPALIKNDGKQTPFKGHPIFVAQHATACCCRSCLEKWHKIKKGRELTDIEIQYIQDLIIYYINDVMSGYSFSLEGEQLRLF